MSAVGGRVWLGIVAAATAAACGGARAPEDDVFLSLPDSVYVEVVNQTLYEARIHAVYRSGARYAVGTVPGNETTVGLAIPWEPRQLAFEVDLIIGFGAFRTDEVVVSRGDWVQLRLPPNVATSGALIRIL